jgi:hypothetical protein
MRGPTQERSHSSSKCVQELLNFKLLEIFKLETHDPLRRYSIQVHKVWQDYLMRHETTQERRHSSAQSVTRASLHQVTWNPWEDPLRRNSIQVHKVWPVFSTSSSLKDHERTHTGEKPSTFQMLKMWQELLEIGPLKELWEDQNRREAFQMFKVWQKLDPHRIIFRWSKCDKSFSIAGHLKEHENPHRRKAFQMFKVWQKHLEIRPLSKPTAEGSYLQENAETWSVLCGV